MSIVSFMSVEFAYSCEILYGCVVLLFGKWKITFVFLRVLVSECFRIPRGSKKSWCDFDLQYVTVGAKRSEVLSLQEKIIIGTKVTKMPMVM